MTPAVGVVAGLMGGRLAFALEPTVHWAAVGSPPDAVFVDGVAGPGGWWGLTDTGAVWRWDAERWSEVAPSADGTWDGLAVHGDGAVWVWQDEPPRVARWDGGAWGPAEDVGAAPLTGLTLDRSGRPFVAASVGLAWVRSDARWVPLAAGDGRGRAIVPTLDGVAVGASDRVVRFDPRGNRQDVPFAAGTSLELLGSVHGVPLLGHDRLHALEAGRFVAVGQEPVRDAACGASTCWVRLPSGDIPHYAFDAGGRVTSLLAVAPPPPAAVRRFAATDTRAWALGQDGTLVETVDGAAPPWVDATDRTGLGMGGERAGVAVGDFDGDGRDDLLLFAPGPTLVVQRAGSFVPYDRLDRSLHEALAGADSVAACDVDGNGLDDVVAWGGGRMTVGRALGDRIEDVSARVGALRLDRDAGRVGRIGCRDVDGDGDPDLLAAGLFAERSWILVNDGYGFFSGQQVAAGHWTVELAAPDGNGDGAPERVAADQIQGGNAFYSSSGAELAPVPESAGWLDRALVTDLDADGRDDVALVDRRVGLRWVRWTAEGPEAAEGPRAGWPAGLGPAVAVGDDLDGDGATDLLACGSAPGRPCRVWLGRPGGPIDVSRGLPLVGAVAGGAGASARVTDVVTFDLGGDGDADLLVVQPGRDLVLENGVNGPPPRHPGAGLGCTRRLRWAEPADVGGWLIAGLAVAAGGLVARRRGGWSGAPGVATVLGAVVSAPVVWLPFADGGVVGRLAAPAALVVLWGGACWGSIRAAARRSAHRVAGYRLERLLGQGGMGRVFIAVEEATGHRVALKLVHPELLDDPADRVLFQREAEVGARVQDPRLVRILGWGEWTVMVEGRPRPTAYLVMELVRGATVRDVLLTRGPLEVPEAMAVVREMALGLAALHRVGVVHRDVKPENAMVVDDGSVRVMDFGAARGVGEARTGARMVLGTLGYLPPEQARGGAVTGAADVFALGVTAHELLTGRRPGAVGPALPVVPSVPSDLRRLLVAATDGVAEQRPTMDAFAEQLRPFAGRARPATPRPAAARGRATSTDDGPQGVGVWPTLRAVWTAWSRLRDEQAPVGPELLAAEVLRAADLVHLDPASRRLVASRLEPTMTALGVTGAAAADPPETWLTPPVVAERDPD